MGKRAVVYARVSTTEQAERGTSLEAQIEACREYAKSKGLEVVGEFTDDYTGTTLDRPGLNELQEALDDGTANAVIVMTEDRLSRNYPDTVMLRSLWADKEIELHFTDTGKVEFTFEGMVIGAFKQISAHNEISTLIRRTKRGRDDKVKKKKKPVLNGTVPYGYDKIGKGRDAKYVINEEEASIVRDIFKWYTVGNSSGGPMSYYAIAKHLNEINAPNPRKKKDHAERWNPNAVGRIIKNELYTGVFIWGKTRCVRKGFQQKGKRVKQPPDKWLRLDMPEWTIIDKATYEAAQERAKKNKRLSKRNRKRKYLLSGHFACGACGRAMCGNCRNPNTKPTLYYRCGSVSRKIAGGKCRIMNRCIRLDEVDGAVWGWLKVLLCDPAALEAGLQEMVENRDDVVGSKKRKLEKLEDLIMDTHIRIKRLVEEMAHQSDELVLETIRTEIQNITDARIALEEERKNLSDELSQVEITQDQQEQIMKFADSVREGLENAGYEDKRYLLDILDVKVVYMNDAEGEWLEVTCAIPTYNDAIVLGTSCNSGFRLPARPGRSADALR